MQSKEALGRVEVLTIGDVPLIYALTAMVKSLNHRQTAFSL